VLGLPPLFNEGPTPSPYAQYRRIARGKLTHGVRAAGRLVVTAAVAVVFTHGTVTGGRVIRSPGTR
jgi:hypothetical protein